MLEVPPIFAVGAVGEPVRLFVENASRTSFVLAQLRPGEIAFPVDERERRLVTAADAAAALTFS